MNKEELHSDLKKLQERHKTSGGFITMEEVQVINRKLKQYDKCKHCCKWKVGCYEG